MGLGNHLMERIKYDPDTGRVLSNSTWVRVKAACHFHSKMECEYNSVYNSLHAVHAMISLQNNSTTSSRRRYT